MRTSSVPSKPNACRNGNLMLHMTGTEQEGQAPVLPRAAALHTQDSEHCYCCDRDVWRHLRLFIGHDNNNRKLTWTQSSSFTHPR
ncbi:hypothetical protein LAZ67_17002779 [Cordylochernes scorpioides]|uniref:Uncharacterized protein n=1 Tax=Cordylochernes scorpioides TaxID=51811 RepID=A0ABY6LIE1_9ARAC|nr:hypothetical protein LAZ67_17002779 [Cordylochernes scorpioides]